MLSLNDLLIAAIAAHREVTEALATLSSADLGRALALDLDPELLGMIRAELSRRE